SRPVRASGCRGSGRCSRTQPSEGHRGVMRAVRTTLGAPRRALHSVGHWSPMTDLPPLRYLPAADVTAAMPSLPQRLALAEDVLRGLAGDAELPSKIGVHPRPPG